MDKLYQIFITTKTSEILEQQQHNMNKKRSDIYYEEEEEEEYDNDYNFKDRLEIPQSSTSTIPDRIIYGRNPLYKGKESLQSPPPSLSPILTTKQQQQQQYTRFSSWTWWDLFCYVTWGFIIYFISMNTIIIINNFFDLYQTETIIETFKALNQIKKCNVLKNHRDPDVHPFNNPDQMRLCIEAETILETHEITRVFKKMISRLETCGHIPCHLFIINIFTHYEYKIYLFIFLSFLFIMFSKGKQKMKNKYNDLRLKARDKYIEHYKQSFYNNNRKNIIEDVTYVS